jgi:hypothetical protein
MTAYWGEASKKPSSTANHNAYYDMNDQAKTHDGRPVATVEWISVCPGGSKLGLDMGEGCRKSC